MVLNVVDAFIIIFLILGKRGWIMRTFEDFKAIRDVISGRIPADILITNAKIVNVFTRDTLLDAQAHPENYPQLTVRVSGYAVNFKKKKKKQQDDVISRTFHEGM